MHSNLLMVSRMKLDTGADAASDLDLQLLKTDCPIDEVNNDAASEGLTATDSIDDKDEHYAKKNANKILNNHGCDGCLRTESPPQVKPSYIKIGRSKHWPVRIRVKRFHHHRKLEEVSRLRNHDQNDQQKFEIGDVVEDGKTAANVKAMNGLEPVTINKEESESGTSADGRWSPALKEVEESDDSLESLPLEPPTMPANNKITKDFMQDLIRY